jgi:hypothetical protein
MSFAVFNTPHKLADECGPIKMMNCSMMKVKLAEILSTLTTLNRIHKFNVTLAAITKVTVTLTTAANFVAIFVHHDSSVTFLR